MKKNILFAGFIVFYCLISTSLFGETVKLISKESLCLAKASNNIEKQKQELQNWIGENRRQSQDEYEKKIDEIEASNGVFDIGMLPELIGLGVHFQEELNHDGAAEAFQRALYIIRVNDGLYSTSQLPIIDLIIESNAARQNWKQVADSYDMMFWLYKRNFEVNDPRQLSTLKRLRRWYIESYNKKTGRSLEQLFRSAEDVYERAIKIMWDCTGGKERETLCFWHKSCCANALPVQEICPLDLD
jgi:hypothetical protein